MYLKSLVLKGFKSFADRSALTLEPGITAVVGPNGSGKSNISDAVLWVLGERNAKNLRGQAMEDVIFAGSSARKASGLAEVDLVLNNSDGTLPVDFDEVAITGACTATGERVPHQRHRGPAHGRAGHSARLGPGHRHPFHHLPGVARLHPAEQAGGSPRAHRGGRRRSQASSARRKASGSWRTWTSTFARPRRGGGGGPAAGAARAQGQEGAHLPGARGPAGRDEPHHRRTICAGREGVDAAKAREAALAAELEERRAPSRRPRPL
ncbi:MAG: AAA family ATPase [Adlercreutzia equolifaciens]